MECGVEYLQLALVKNIINCVFLPKIITGSSIFDNSYHGYH